MMTEQLWLWIGFSTFALAMLALDLGVLHRKSHVASFCEATRTVAWIRHASNNSLRVKGTLWN